MTPDNAEAHARFAGVICLDETQEIRSRHVRRLRQLDMQQFGVPGKPLPVAFECEWNTAVDPEGREHSPTR
ncbi:MAG: hypothetical protein OXL36_04040 [Bryobacterales bacterium]|nr:hypothetical protein [Bryobacterales bacterium]